MTVHIYVGWRFPRGEFIHRVAVGLASSKGGEVREVREVR